MATKTKKKSSKKISLSKHVAEVEKQVADMKIAPLKEALDALGRTPEEVARHLERMKIKGTVGDAASCPVARYLKGIFSDEVQVSGGEIEVDGVEFKSSVISKFVDKFDEKKFPNLIDPKNPGTEDDD